MLCITIKKLDINIQIVTQMARGF